MKSSFAVAAVAAGLLAGCQGQDLAGPAPRQAVLADFVGSWVNEDPEVRGISRTEIVVDGDDVFVEMWATCGPGECDWGRSRTVVADAQDGVLEVRWNSGFAVRYQAIVWLPDGRLRIETWTNLTDFSGRPDHTETGWFVR